MSTKFAAIWCSTSLINTLLPVISGIMLYPTMDKAHYNTLTNHPPTKHYIAECSTVGLG